MPVSLCVVRWTRTRRAGSCRAATGGRVLRPAAPTLQLAADGWRHRRRHGAAPTAKGPAMARMLTGHEKGPASGTLLPGCHESARPAQTGGCSWDAALVQCCAFHGRPHMPAGSSPPLLGLAWLILLPEARRLALVGARGAVPVLGRQHAACGWRHAGHEAGRGRGGGGGKGGRVRRRLCVARETRVSVASTHAVSATSAHARTLGEDIPPSGEKGCPPPWPATPATTAAAAADSLLLRASCDRSCC